MTLQDGQTQPFNTSLLCRHEWLVGVCLERLFHPPSCLYSASEGGDWNPWLSSSTGVYLQCRGEAAALAISVSTGEHSAYRQRQQKTGTECDRVCLCERERLSFKILRLDLFYQKIQILQTAEHLCVFAMTTLLPSVLQQEEIDSPENSSHFITSSYYNHRRGANISAPHPADSRLFPSSLI